MPELAYSAVRHRATLREVSDRELLAVLARGDEAALAELVQRKTRPLLQVAARILGDEEEARDVVQMTFLRLWEHRDRFDDRWSPNTWIYRIATNLAIDHWRSKKSRERASEPVRFHLLARADAACEDELAELEGSEVAAIFRELAADLTEKQRLVFVLRELQGLSSQEVAEVAGCEESTVRNHLFNARKVLRARLLAKYPEYARGRRAPGAPA
ncbi:MAG: sigma-70 family RNA polymerase sigma factor [Thermoanaerobaculia bacterium]